MKYVVLVTSFLFIVSCAVKDKNVDERIEELELIPEPDKNLREQYVKEQEAINIKQNSIEIEANSSLLKLFEHVAKLDEAKTWTTIDSVSLMESSDGGDGVYYFLGDSLLRVTADYYGESGQYKEEYYLDKGKLVFSTEKELRYNRPYYYDSTMMEEFNDTVFFDIEKSTSTLRSHFFVDGTLVRQTEETGEVKTSSSTGLEEAETVIKESFQALLKKRQ